MALPAPVYMNGFRQEYDAASLRHIHIKCFCFRGGQIPDEPRGVAVRLQGYCDLDFFMCMGQHGGKWSLSSVHVSAYGCCFVGMKVVDKKSKYWSVFMGFLQTEVEMNLSSLCLRRMSRKGSCPLVLITTDWMWGPMELMCWYMEPVFVRCGKGTGSVIYVMLPKPGGLGRSLGLLVWHSA